ncbi:hypothetical protein RB195_018585 [Necator americanus]|uniref:Uncharacterized protein n=1 Tax=Necator americanus TaxID=51031 RepID=A0ABR1CBI9_NECAM
MPLGGKKIQNKVENLFRGISNVWGTSLDRAGCGSSLDSDWQFNVTRRMFVDKDSTFPLGIRPFKELNRFLTRLLFPDDQMPSVQRILVRGSAGRVVPTGIDAIDRREMSFLDTFHNLQLGVRYCAQGSVVTSVPWDKEVQYCTSYHGAIPARFVLAPTPPVRITVIEAELTESVPPDESSAFLTLRDF